MLNFVKKCCWTWNVFAPYWQVLTIIFVQFWDKWIKSTIHIYYHWALAFFMIEFQNLNWIKLNRFFSFVSTVKNLLTRRKTIFLSHAGSSSQSLQFSATSGFAESLAVHFARTAIFNSGFHPILNDSFVSALPLFFFLLLSFSLLFVFSLLLVF